MGGALAVSVARAAIILAAGQGTRMKSPLPKVLHPLAGAPMVTYAIEAALGTDVDEVVLVVGHGRDAVIRAIRERFGNAVRFGVQTRPRGTADAVRAGLTAVSRTVDEVLISYADVPCVSSAALRELVDARRATGASLGMVTCTVDDPAGSGRILRDARGNIVAIREHRDCSPAERAIREINRGFYAADRHFLVGALGALRADNVQREYYLTDVVAAAAARHGVTAVAWDSRAPRGVNDRAELAAAEAQVWQRIAEDHRRAGSTIAPGVAIDHDVVIGRGATVCPGAVLRGQTRVGDRALIHTGCVLEDAVVGDRAVIKPYSRLTRCTVQAGTQVGPHAHVGTRFERSTRKHRAGAGRRHA